MSDINFTYILSEKRYLKVPAKSDSRPFTLNDTRRGNQHFLTCTEKNRNYKSHAAKHRSHNYTDYSIECTTHKIVIVS